MSTHIENEIVRTAIEQTRLRVCATTREPNQLGLIGMGWGLQVTDRGGEPVILVDVAGLPIIVLTAVLSAN